MAKVYVSSTVADLEEERRAVMEWLRAARHQAVDSYLPDSDTVRNSCLDDIDSCDLYVLILGHRYGFQPTDGNPESLSITHLEFRRAAKIPRIALVRTSVPDSRLSDIDNPGRMRLVSAFRAEVAASVRAAEFSDLHGLIQGLSTGIQHEFDKLQQTSGYHSAPWLSAHLHQVGKQFTDHMAASALRSSAAPAQLYVELLLRNRGWGADETPSREAQASQPGRTLDDVIENERAPLLVLGEGGAGKTTSVLYAAARAADRALANHAAAVPIYVNLAKLTAFEDVADLHRLIVDSVSPATAWEEIIDGARAAGRPLLFLLDSFNELPEHLHRTGAVVLKRFVEKQQKTHGCLIASRLVPHLEQLGRPPSEFCTFDILRLTPDRVQAFLQELGLGSLYDRLPAELRDLAGNPFMLSAIVGTLAGKPDDALPRNRGKLFESFAREWMAREAKKQRGLLYSYERVKEPLLVYLGLRMTSAGETSLERTDVIDDEIEGRLETVYGRIKRRGGMPDHWTVDEWVNETTGDGLLKSLGGRLYFMHQSVQEYFTGMHFTDDTESLVQFTPRLIWESVTTYALADLPNHRFVPALLIASGLLDDSTAVVERLADRNPLLAAAAIASSTHVDAALVERLEQRWLALLDDEDLRRRVVGCSCIVLAMLRSRRVIQRLASFATDETFDNNYIGKPALARLGAQAAVARELIHRTSNLTDNEFEARKRTIAEALAQVQNAEVMSIVVESWRAFRTQPEMRQRVESLIAGLDESLLVKHLEALRTNRSDPSLTADAEEMLAVRGSWERATGPLVSAARLRRLAARAREQYAQNAAESAKAMAEADPSVLLQALQSTDVAQRTGAALAAAQRGEPIGDAILAAVFRWGDLWQNRDLIGALVELWGEPAAVARLVDAARHMLLVRRLDPRFAEGLELGELPESLRRELEGLFPDANLELDSVESHTDGSVSYRLASRRWSGIRSVFELRAAGSQLELYDCAIAVKAFGALAEIPGERATSELRRALRHEDADVRQVAFRELAQRRDPGLDRVLLGTLKSTISPELALAALDALRTLQSREALRLLDELPVLSEGRWSDAHPLWGECSRVPGFADTIHRVLAALNADESIQMRLDDDLSSIDPRVRSAASRELSRWLTDRDIDSQRRASWISESRLHRILEVALSDDVAEVRHSAAGALKALASADIANNLAQRLADETAGGQVAAAEALLLLEAEHHFPAVVEAMRRIVKGTHTLELRKRAGGVLLRIPGGADPFHEPIQSALVNKRPREALVLIASALEVFAEDVDLFWWRGHAQRALREWEDAAASYQRAAELVDQAPVIPQALAETFLELHDYAGAVEAARRGVELAPYDADAQATLAWSCYRCGTIKEAISAATMGLDLEPVHPSAIWVAVLAQLRHGDADAARAAFEHARNVKAVLSPGLDGSFLPTFLGELDELAARNPATSPLIADMKRQLECDEDTIID